MPLSADTLIDRIRLKNQLTRWRVIAVLVAVAAVVLMLEKDSQFAPIRGDYIARITVSGIIMDDPDLTALVEEVREDHHAKAVLLWLDTPGGSAVGGQQLYLDLRKLAKDKPVVAVMRSLAASAGYMAALGADHVIAREGTITGSIGVIMETAEFSELAKKLGIRPIVLKTGENKGSPSPVEPFTARQEAVLQASINDFFRWFVNMVAERRKLPIDQVEQMADGRIFSGQQALDSKLIDQLGGEEEALAWLEKTRKIEPELDIRDMEIKHKPTGGFFSELARGTISSLMGAGAPSMDGLVAIWKPNAL